MGFILGLHELIRVPHAVAFPVVFKLLFDRGQHVGVLKPTTNNHFQVFLTVWVIFLKFVSCLTSGI